jgi:hypothetical protein
MSGRVVPNADGQSFETATAFVSIDPVSGKAFGKGGENGVTVTTNTTAVTGSFTAIQVLEDATFSVFTETGAVRAGHDRVRAVHRWHYPVRSHHRLHAHERQSPSLRMSALALSLKLSRDQDAVSAASNAPSTY